MLRPSRHALWGVVWFLGSVAAMYAAMQYDFIPGTLGVTPLRWPAEAQLHRHLGMINVVAFVHPRCPCTRATLHQLIRTMQRHPKAALLVSVFVPRATADLKTWQEGEYVRMIRAAFPRADIVFDAAGVEASRFGAFTSGTILVYDRQGTELFRGGITDRRGGEGENIGVRTFDRVLTVTAHTGTVSPVFGCPLVVPQQSVQHKGETDGRVASPHAI